MGKNRNANNIGYPAAVLVKEACYNEYIRMIQTYDKIYEKVNISLAFCGALLLVIIKEFDFAKILQLKTAANNKEAIVYIIYGVAFICSVGYIFSTVIGLLGLLKGREIITFDSISARDNELYAESEQDAAVWLLDKYTKSVQSLQDAVKEKQVKYDETIGKAIIALLSFAVASIIEKGI